MTDHRAALLAKDAKHYGQFGWTETPGGGGDWSNEDLDLTSTPVKVFWEEVSEEKE